MGRSTRWVRRPIADGAPILLSGLALLVCLALGAAACSRAPRVWVPPRVDLASYPLIGIVGFGSNATGNLEEFATQRFMQAVQHAQPGTRLLELGSETDVLAAIGRSRMDFEAVRAIGQKWGVDAVFAGALDVSNVRPRVQLGRVLESFALQADVDAALQVKLTEARTGAVVWTRASRSSAPVANVRIGSRGPIDFDARDPERAYGALTRTLIDRVADDFYGRWR
jgi:hypothetical protein